MRRRTLCGTAGYSPPEQFGERYVDYRNRNGYDERVDFFSLGVTLFTMVCGRRPFPTRRQMLSQVEGISSPTRRRSSISDHPSSMQRAATRKLLKDIEFRCEFVRFAAANKYHLDPLSCTFPPTGLMSEVKFLDFLHDFGAKSSFCNCWLKIQTTGQDLTVSRTTH